MHAPVLLEEVLRELDPKPGKFFVDGTLDGGGHAQAILAKLGPKGKFLGMDWDASMIAHAREKFRDDKRVTLVTGNYADLAQVLAEKKLPKANGLLLDLGFSSAQLENGKGFSFSGDEPLTMTYSESELPVSEILKRLTEKQLAEVIYELSGEMYSRRIAHAIKTSRRPIRTTAELREAVLGAVPENYEHGRIHPATRTFQALRIYANRELENLKKVLAELPAILAPGGRAAIISFHSLEDKLVKNAFRDLARKKQAKLLTEKPLEAGAQEILANPRSRSAKLRVLQMA